MSPINFFAKYFISKNRIVLIVLSSAAVLLLMYMVFGRDDGKNIYDVLGDVPYRGKTIFFETVIQFEPIPYIIEKMSAETIDAVKNQQFFYHNYRNKSWIVDQKMRRGYAFLPNVDFDLIPWVMRIKPDITLDTDLTTLSGKYVCTGYIHREWEPIGLKRILTFTITSLRKKTLLFTSQTKKLPLPDIHSSEEEKEFWKAFVEVTYQSQKLPEIEPEKMLINSVPNGLKVFITSKTDLDSCYQNGKIDLELLKKNVFTHEKLRCVSPAYIAYPKESSYVFFEFVSPFDNLMQDDCSVQVSEMRQDGKFLIWRGYLMEVNNKIPSNTLLTAFFLLRGLDSSELLRLIESDAYFDLDKPLFDVFIGPVLSQCKKDGADASLTPQLCARIMQATGKLAIDTYTGTYIFNTIKKADGAISLQTNKRCTEFLLNNKQVIQQLPQFFYRK